MFMKTCKSAHGCKDRLCHSHFVFVFFTIATVGDGNRVFHSRPTLVPTLIQTCGPTSTKLRRKLANSTVKHLELQNTRGWDDLCSESLRNANFCLFWMREKLRGEVGHKVGIKVGCKMISGRRFVSQLDEVGQTLSFQLGKSWSLSWESSWA